VQTRALEAVALDRRAGSRAGLVVLATGLGKTFLAAFVRERERFGKTLFVAHRAEILSQAESTFPRLDDRMKTSYISGDESDASGQLVLASVQKLGREPASSRIAADAFDLVVIDEFHHAPASQSRRILHHFRPKYLLGLTRHRVARMKRMHWHSVMEILCSATTCLRRLEAAISVRSTTLEFGIQSSTNRVHGVADSSNSPNSKRRFSRLYESSVRPRNGKTALDLVAERSSSARRSSIYG
jgi:hypothetical protein